ncbi:hypothetical protein SAMN05720354_11048 [Nitrosospira sp. Nsp1]|nr:hypothetical protein SAMN05720354_11048 [Nitrosospira sp. Nsp1]
MTSKETLPSLETTVYEVFTGTVKLTTLEALGIQDVLIVVTDNTINHQKHMLQIQGSIEEQPRPGGKVEYALRISSADGTPEIGPPLPGKRKKRNEVCEYEGCDWLVRSERHSGGDWIEKTRRCIGDSPCPYNKIVRQP